MGLTNGNNLNDFCGFFFQPLLVRKMKIHDTCGVHNLHGLPGVLGAIASAIVIGVAQRETYLGRLVTLNAYYNL